MQAIVITLIVVGILAFGAKQVAAFMRAFRMKLHDHNMQRRGEKEAEKMRKKQEEDIYTWKAHCANAREAQPGSRGAREERAADGSITVWYGEDEPVDAEPVAASVLSAETV